MLLQKYNVRKFFILKKKKKDILSRSGIIRLKLLKPCASQLSLIYCPALHSFILIKLIWNLPTLF